jgi:hypothetical protein
MIGPPPTVDVMEELRRLGAMRDVAQQADALRLAPAEVFEAIELALQVVRAPLLSLRLYSNESQAEHD